MLCIDGNEEGRVAAPISHPQGELDIHKEDDPILQEGLSNLI